MLGCVSCDALGSYYQPAQGSTACVICATHTQRYVGVLSAANKTACQCKEGAAHARTRLRPQARVGVVFALQHCIRSKHGCAPAAGYYSRTATAGEVRSARARTACLFSCSQSLMHSIALCRRARSVRRNHSDVDPRLRAQPTGGVIPSWSMRVPRAQVRSDPTAKGGLSHRVAKVCNMQPL